MVSSSGSYMLDNEILKDGNKIFEIDSSKYSIEEIGEIIASLFIKNAKYQNLKTINEEKYRFGKISWLSDKSLPLNFFTS